MQITSTQTYNATPDEVFAMMSDEAYLAAVCDRFRVTERTINVTGPKSTVSMALPAPSQVQKIVGNSLRLNQVITWSEPAADGSRTGTLDMTVEKAPVDVKGSAVLKPQGGQTVVTYTADMNVKIPLLGKKLEQQAAPMVQKALDAQQQVGEKYLADKRA